VRTVVGGKATGSYLGKVAVARGAQKTDAAQSVKAMLLDRTATANAKPELEIFADDVKCAHGATVGELDQAALFYLASRGLPPAEAKQLLLQAFVAGVFEGAEDEEALTAAALSKLGAMV
jgi:Fe-S cluster assembly protein SufD